MQTAFFQNSGRVSVQLPARPNAATQTQQNPSSLPGGQDVSRIVAQVMAALTPEIARVVGSIV
jgi:hypothetical protein